MARRVGIWDPLAVRQDPVGDLESKRHPKTRATDPGVIPVGVFLRGSASESALVSGRSDIPPGDRSP